MGIVFFVPLKNTHAIRTVPPNDTQAGRKVPQNKKIGAFVIWLNPLKIWSNKLVRTLKCRDFVTRFIHVEQTKSVELSRVSWANYFVAPHTLGLFTLLTVPWNSNLTFCNYIQQIL